MTFIVKNRLILPALAVLALVALALTGCVAGELDAAGLPPAQAGDTTECDLTSSGAACSVSGALFQQGTLPGPAGSGVLSSFIRLGSGNEAVIQGYNSDFRPVQFDEDNSPTFNRALLLSEVPAVVVGNEIYREFVLDINQSQCNNGNPTGCRLSLDGLQLFASPSATLTAYDPVAGNFDPSGGGPAELLYDLSGTVTLDGSLVGSGSGRSDMFFYVPESAFSGIAGCHYGATGCATYITLYSRFGETLANNGGFEEWAVSDGAADRGTLIVIKEAIPATGEDFAFALTGGPDATDVGFTLDDAETDDGDAYHSILSLSLPAGTYAVTETPPVGWLLESATCTASSGVPAEPGAVALEPGGTVACTFRNSGGATTETPTATGTITATETVTGTATVTPTGTLTGTVTVTPTETITTTATAIPTETAMPTETGEPSATPTDVVTATPTITTTETATPTETVTATVTATATVPVGADICPAGEGANRMTAMLGAGLGNDDGAFGPVEVQIPNAGDLVALYGQIAGKNIGEWERARFTYPNGTNEDVTDLTSPAYRRWAIFWYGAELGIAESITGQLLPAESNSARALVLYPTYETADLYVDVVRQFAESEENIAYWFEAGGWTARQTQVIDIPAPLGAANITVAVALVDNDDDARVVELTVSAGGVSETVTQAASTHGDMLSIVPVTLAGVPAGTSTIEVTLVSPEAAGDSVAMIGLTAGYPCVAGSAPPPPTLVPTMTATPTATLPAVGGGSD